ECAGCSSYDSSCSLSPVPHSPFPLVHHSPFTVHRSRSIFRRMPEPGHPNLTILSHPLIQHKLTLLRDKRTSTRDFKQLVSEIAMLMAYEVTKDLPTQPVEINTPPERTPGRQVAGKKLTLVPILRAGLGMVDGVAQLVPSARV